MVVIKGTKWEECIPVHLHEGLLNYVNHRIRTGGFLESVLSGELYRIFPGSASKTSLDSIEEIVAFIVEEFPVECWGSRGNVESYLGLRNL
jgi:hypothetical protein